MIELPPLCGTRHNAQELADGEGDHSVLVDASNVISMAQGFADELCKSFINNNVDRVSFNNAPERLEKFFMRAHMLRQAKFLVEFH